MTGHRALEKKQITQGNNRKVQNPSGSLKKDFFGSPFCFYMPSDFRKICKLANLQIKINFIV